MAGTRSRKKRGVASTSSSADARTDARRSSRNHQNTGHPVTARPTEFSELEWERQTPQRPTNGQRALLGAAIGLILAWSVALGWLVTDRLSK